MPYINCLAILLVLLIVDVAVRQFEKKKEPEPELDELLLMEEELETPVLELVRDGRWLPLAAVVVFVLKWQVYIELEIDILEAWRYFAYEGVLLLWVVLAMLGVQWLARRAINHLQPLLTAETIAQFLEQRRPKPAWQWRLGVLAGFLAAALAYDSGIDQIVAVMYSLAYFITYGMIVYCVVWLFADVVYINQLVAATRPTSVGQSDAYEAVAWWASALALLPVGGVTFSLLLIDFSLNDVLVLAGHAAVWGVMWPIFALVVWPAGRALRQFKHHEADVLVQNITAAGAGTAAGSVMATQQAVLSSIPVRAYTAIHLLLLISVWLLPLLIVLTKLFFI